MIELVKRGEGRPKLIRSGMAGRPQKEYKCQHVDREITEGDSEDKEFEV